MKIQFAFVFVMFFAAILTAQVPQQINYQGVLTDGSGAIVADGNYDLTFTIYDAATAGNNLWTDTFNNVPTENGVFNVTLGSGAALNINFDAPYWIGIAVGGGSELAPRIALTSSPYSIRTKSIEITDAAGQSAVSAINAATSGTINAARLGSGTADNSTFLRGDNTWAAPSVSASNIASVLTAGNTANDGQNMAIDEIRARDAGGLTLNDDGGNGLIIEDGGAIIIGNSSTTQRFEVFTSGGGWTYGANISNRVVVAAANSADAGDWGAENAFDGNVETYWSTSAGNPTGWISADFGSGNSYTIEDYKITAYGPDLPTRPDDWQFQGSNNGTDWTSIETRTNEAANITIDTATTKLFATTNTTAYRYYRLNITGNNGSADYVAIGELVFYSSGSVSNPSFVIDNSGRVGIGDNSPTEALTVNGSIIHSGAILTYSDKNLKTNIELLTNVLSKLKDINSYYYNWKKNPESTSKEIGILAQEIETHFPELVKTGSNGIKAVDYTKLSAILLEAVKEQQLMIDDQNKRLDLIEKTLKLK